MTKIKQLIVLSACLFSGAAAADAVIVAGQVVGEDAVPLQSLSVQIDGRPVDIDSAGRFEFTIETHSSEAHALGISADDYYSTRQTVHRSDFMAGSPAAMAPIELVRKKAGRKLLMFAGDAMLSRRYFEPRNGEPVLVRDGHKAEDIRALLQHVKPYIELADYASVNLETQLSSTPLTDRLPKSVTFYSPPELAGALKWAGFDYVALGNNHMFDYQQSGLDSTLAILDRLDLDYSGGGLDDAAARVPAVVSIGDERHAFMSYVGWSGTFSPSQVAETGKGGAALGNSAVIAADFKKIPVDATTVLQLHSGLEYSERPALTEQTTLRQAVRDGVDLALGHHAHVLQGFEIVDNRLVAYSLGNFLFDQYHYTTQMGMLLFVWMDGDRLHRAEIVPLHINGYVPTPATGAFRYSVLHRLAKLSDPASTCVRPTGMHAVLEACNSGQALQHVKPLRQNESSLPLALRDLGMSAVSAIEVQGADSAYRLGVDILRRGDFEYAGLFDTTDRTWIESDDVQVRTGVDTNLTVEIPAGGNAARTGQKVFERVFSLSNPATVSGRITVDDAVRLRVFLQRRRTSDSLEGALVNGPMTEIGTIELPSSGAHEFSFDYNQPRIATVSVRLVFELEDTTNNGGIAALDDLTWVEWRTPWVDPDDVIAPAYATHLQFQK